MGRCTTAMRRWSRDQNSKPEVNSRDVIKWRSERYVRRSQYLEHIFEPNLVQNTNTTLSTRRNGQIHINWKSKITAVAILNFGKIVNNFGLDKDILHQIIWENASRRRGDERVTKSRNRKLIRVTSSNEGLKHVCVCVDFSDYNIYLNQIRYRTHSTLSTRRNGQIHRNWKSKMAAAANLKVGKMSITVD